MGKKLEKLRSKAVLVSVGAALLLTGVGVGTGYAITGSSPDTRTVSDDSAVTEPAATSSAEATTQAEPPVVQPEPVAPTSSVARVTSSQHAPADQPDPAGTGIGATGPDGNYTPAPPPERPGQPPMGSIAPEAPAPKLPGEPGYVPPAG